MLNPRPIATAATPAPGARALYLGAGQHKRVTCTDEALVVTNARAQTWRYPLDRVARVVSSTATDWSGAALALCLRRGIGIAWLDPRGAALGVCYPQARSATGSAAALEIMVETPEGVERYRHWQRARRMDVLMRWSASRPPSGRPPSASGFMPANTPCTCPLGCAAIAWPASGPPWPAMPCRPRSGAQRRSASIWTKTCANCSGPR
jgi:hypothetical protein